jgi:hypothetical protein
VVMKSSVFWDTEQCMTFRRNMSPLSSGSKNKTRNLGEAGGKRSLAYFQTEKMEANTSVRFQRTTRRVSQWHVSGPVCAAALGPEGQFLLSLALRTLTQRICKMAARKLGSLHQGEHGHKAANHLYVTPIVATICTTYFSIHKLLIINSSTCFGHTGPSSGI